MSETCPACEPVAPISGWKKFGAWVGVFFFCPCHLPVTVGGMLLLLSASGFPIARSWGQPLVYGVFTLTFTFFVVVLIRMAVRRRERERLQEAEHDLHSSSLPAMGAPIPRSLEETSA